MWKTPVLDKTWIAEAAIASYRFCKFGTDDEHMVQASASTDSIIGVSGSVGATLAGDPIDLTLIGIGEITLAETLSRGAQVTSDAAGKAVAAVDGDQVGGKLLMSGVAGDVVPILLHAADDSDAVPVRQVDITVSAAALKTLNATPVQLVVAPGAGKALIFDSAILMLDYATTAYDGIAAGEDLAIKYTDASGATLVTIETTGFLDATADATRFVKATTAAAITPVANAALVLHMLTGEIATGDSPLKVRVFYRVIPTTL